MSRPEESELEPVRPSEMAVSLPPEMENSQLELARARTRWALVRTRLAKERTFNAWLRSGLAVMGAGLAVAHLMANHEPRWFSQPLAVLLVMLGGAIIALGLRTYYRVIQQVEQFRIGGHPFWHLLVLTILLILAAVLGLIGMLVQW